MPTAQFDVELAQEAYSSGARVGICLLKLLIILVFNNQ